MKMCSEAFINVIISIKIGNVLFDRVRVSV